MNNEPVSPQIKAIRDRYKASLPEKAQLIAEHIEIVSAAPNDYAYETHELLHRLAGSSGMYGYGDISEACRSAMTSAVEKNVSDLKAKLLQVKELLEQHA